MKNDYIRVIIFIVLSVLVLIVSAQIDYSFFHVTADLAAIFLGLTIYIIASYSSKYSKGSNLLFVGVAYLSVSIIDLMHLINDGGFSHTQMDLNTATQYWIGARFTEAFVLFFAYSKLLKVKNMSLKILVASFGFTTLVILLFVSFSQYFPLMYDLDGFTFYKKVMDILIILLFIFAFITIRRHESRKFNRIVLIIAIGFKIFSEVTFLFNSGEVEILNILRYISKYISYVLLFVVFARDFLVRPYENIFRAFKDKEDELLELTKRDSLTGLYNHSTSYEIIREIITKNETSKNDICLMMIDIDDFKCINDKYGHIKGDEVLLGVANLFKHCDGPLKLAGRYGGDEFVVLFVDCDGNLAEIISNKLFNKLKKLSIEIGITVTISIGISEWEKRFTAKDLVRSADYQMYVAKSIGKSTFSLKQKSDL